MEQKEERGRDERGRDERGRRRIEVERMKRKAKSFMHLFLPYHLPCQCVVFSQCWQQGVTSPPCIAVVPASVEGIHTYMSCRDESR